MAEVETQAGPAGLLFSVRLWTGQGKRAAGDSGGTGDTPDVRCQAGGFEKTKTTVRLGHVRRNKLCHV